MNTELQTFMEFSAMSDLAPLILEQQPALLVSDDGCRCLWANAAAARMFSVNQASVLSELADLERSPARPHIARIARSGQEDKPSIDRLRFFCGRKMVLATCQCRRMVLADGSQAALILCADRFLALSGDPAAEFAKLLQTGATSTFLMKEGQLEESNGATPFTPDLLVGGSDAALDGGTTGLNGVMHVPTTLNLTDGRQIIVLQNPSLYGDSPLPGGTVGDAPPHHDGSDTGVKADPENPAETGFTFTPRKRPVRFAWQMDVDQRFTFLSGELAETLGADVTGITGLTWQEAAERFSLDPDGSIAQALERRETWSGITVDWPVSGSDLLVPVDLAALPAFDRHRVFEGYRGFGVCRTIDAFLPPEPEEASPQETAPVADPVEPAVSEDAETAVTGVQAITSDNMTGTGTPSTELSMEDHPVQPVPKDEAGGTPDQEITQEDETSVPAGEPRRKASSGVYAAGILLGAQTIGAFDGSGTPGQHQLDTQALDDSSTGPGAEEFSDPQEETAQDPHPLNATIDNGADPARPVSDPQDLPAGIEGPASMGPEDIESAVETLAATYPQQVAGPHQVPGQATGEYADTEAEDPEVEALMEPIDPADAAGPLTAVPETDPAGITWTEASETNSSGVDETLQTDPDHEPAPELAGISDYEAEFHAETTAYLNEDEDAANSNSAVTPFPAAGPAMEPEDNGNVIPLTTARPRLVPVDTSGLSRPERQAFRKIAEALGARLEGVLDDFDDAGDGSPSGPEPVVSDAGPIDPRLLDKLPIGIAIVHDREVLYANDTLLTLLGYRTLGALSEAGGLEALFVDDSEELPDADGMDGEIDETLKVRLADGGLRSVDAHMHSVPWNDGRGLMISIKERPQPQQAATNTPPPNFFAGVRADLDSARLQIEELETILDNAANGVVITDRRGTILKANASAEALFSFDRAAMIGTPMPDLLAPESHQLIRDYISGQTTNGDANFAERGIEVAASLPTGDTVPLSLTMGVIAGDDGEDRCFAVFHDLTASRSAEDELKQAKRQAENASTQKSEFLAKISHEIRTPLNAIIGFSEVMIEERFGVVGNDRYRDYLNDIRASGTHIMSLINDLLDLSKIEAGKLDLQFDPLSANDMINECIGLLQHQANRNRVIIRASLPDTVPEILADERSLRQIVLNLLSNAIKFNKPGGQVILSTAREQNGEVVLRVRDTGTGMSDEQVKAALEPFRQLHTTAQGGGTGLGLPLTKALVEANQAGFHIDSTPGQGTLVEIVFPADRLAVT